MATPAPKVPVVTRFSSPKEILPLESVIEPSAKVRFPIEDPVERVATPAPKVPVVLRFSSPKEIAPVLSVITPVEILIVSTSSKLVISTLEPAPPRVKTVGFPLLVVIKLPTVASALVKSIPVIPARVVESLPRVISVEPMVTELEASLETAIAAPALMSALTMTPSEIATVPVSLLIEISPERVTFLNTSPSLPS